MGFFDKLFGRKSKSNAAESMTPEKKEEPCPEDIEDEYSGVDDVEEEYEEEEEDPWADYEEGVVYADDGWPGVNSLEVLERDDSHIRFLVMPRNTFFIKDGVKYSTGMSNGDYSIVGFIKEWSFATPNDMELVSCTGFDFVDVPCMTETQIERDTGATRYTFESYIVSGDNLERVMSDIRSAISAYIESGVKNDFAKHAKTLLKAEPFDPASVEFDPEATKHENGSFKFKVQKRTAKKGSVPKIPLKIEGSCGIDKCHVKAVLYYTSSGVVDRAELFMDRRTSRTYSSADVRCKANDGIFAPDMVEQIERR